MGMGVAGMLPKHTYPHLLKLLMLTKALGLYLKTKIIPITGFLFSK